MHTLLVAILTLVLALITVPAYAGSGGPYDGMMTALLALIAILLAGLMWCCYRKRGP
jgi:hypothetical protein